MVLITDVRDSILRWVLNVVTSSLPGTWSLAPMQLESMERHYVNMATYLAAFCTFVVCTVVYMRRQVAQVFLHYRFGFEEQTILSLVGAALCTKILWPGLLMFCYFFSCGLFPYATCIVVAVWSYFQLWKAEAAPMQNQLPCGMRTMHGQPYSSECKMFSVDDSPSPLLTNGEEYIPDSSRRSNFESSSYETCPECGSSYMFNDYESDSRRRLSFGTSTSNRSHEQEIPDISQHSTEDSYHLARFRTSTPNRSREQEIPEFLQHSIDDSDHLARPQTSTPKRDFQQVRDPRRRLNFQSVTHETCPECQPSYNFSDGESDPRHRLSIGSSTLNQSREKKIPELSQRSMENSDNLVRARTSTPTRGFQQIREPRCRSNFQSVTSETCPECQSSYMFTDGESDPRRRLSFGESTLNQSREQKIPEFSKDSNGHSNHLARYRTSTRTRGL